MKVKATEKGYDGLEVREKGDVFDIKDEAFDEHWMEKVGGKVEKPVTESAQVPPAPVVAAPAKAPAGKPKK